MKNRNPDKGFLFFCALAFASLYMHVPYSICFSQNRTASSIQPSAFVPVPSPKPCPKPATTLKATGIPCPFIFCALLRMTSGSAM